MGMHCLLCSYKNRYPYHHRISMSFMLLERFCDTEQRCRPGNGTETRGITQRHHDQVSVCIVHWCLCQNRIQHFHHMSRWFFLERCCNIEQRHRPRSALETRGILQGFRDREWLCTAYWCLYQIRYPHFDLMSMSFLLVERCCII